MVKRNRSHRKTIVPDDTHLLVEEVPLDRLDEQIRLRSQNGAYSLFVFLYGVDKLCYWTETDTLTI